MVNTYHMRSVVVYFLVRGYMEADIALGIWERMSEKMDDGGKFSSEYLAYIFGDPAIEMAYDLALTTDLNLVRVERMAWQRKK